MAANRAEVADVQGLVPPSSAHRIPTTPAGGRAPTASGVALAATPVNPPVFDFFGAYLPAWLPAMGLGFLAMVVLRGVLVVLGVHQRMPGRVFVYIAATVLFSCLAWLAMA